MSAIESELRINNKSYVNKDFISIYTELLELVGKLTDKWDPKTSNESDVGVVLIKLGALLADKNNYNIDKNVLETFPASVTQNANARKLYDMLGYNMHWYRSATTSVSFLYRGKFFTEYPRYNSITIPKYTMIANDTTDVVYTLLSDVKLNKAGVTVTGDCIEGTIQDYNVNGVSNITLDNLDADFKLYFMDNKVAENGIFVVSSGTHETWERVDNLESHALNSKIFKFGVATNSDACYIQFPQDIANLIGNGITIKYVISSGSNGNIKAKTLTSFYADVIPAEIAEATDGSGTAINGDMTISNLSSTANGADPENIDDAYRNYKKTVGTFDTLVTCRDYENFIYNIYDSYSNYVASNAVVSDRTNDLNRSLRVCSLTSGGSNVATYSDVNNPNSGMGVTDIGLYVLAPMASIYNDFHYNKSFSVNTDKYYIQSRIADVKSVQHKYITIRDTDNFIYKNFMTLVGKVITYYKVTNLEASEIEANIKTALFQRFNARKVEFGVEPNFDDIVATIQEADTRIKSVLINEPEYNLRIMMPTDFEGSFESSKMLSWDDYKKIFISMIMNGTVQLYKFDKSVNYDFGIKDIKRYDNIATISSTSKIDKNYFTGGADKYYQIKPNESIQLYAPNLYTETTYTQNICYRYTNASANATDSIQPNIEYCLGEGEELELYWKDTEHNPQLKKYGAGTIVKSNIELAENATSSVSYNGKNYATTSATATIEIRKVNAVQLSGPTVACLFFTNDVRVSDANSKNYQYLLFGDGEDERLLKDNEYFIYTNTERNALVILGSGTLLKRKGVPGVGGGIEYRTVAMTNLLDVSNVQSDGLSAISNTDWFKYETAVYGELFTIETQTVSLGQGCYFHCDSIDGANSLGNTPVKVTNPTYKEPGEANATVKTLPQFSRPILTIGEDNGVAGATTATIECVWKAYSALNLSASNSIGQELGASQELTLSQPAFTISGSGGMTNTPLQKIEGSVDGTKSVYFNSVVALSGGDGLDTSVLTDTGLSHSLSASVIERVKLPVPNTNPVRYTALPVIGQGSQAFELARLNDGFIHITLSEALLTNNALMNGSSYRYDGGNIMLDPAKIAQGLKTQLDFMFPFVDNFSQAFDTANDSGNNPNYLVEHHYKYLIPVVFSNVKSSDVEVEITPIGDSGNEMEASLLTSFGSYAKSGSAPGLNFATNRDGEYTRFICVEGTRQNIVKGIRFTIISKTKTVTDVKDFADVLLIGKIYVIDGLNDEVLDFYGDNSDYANATEETIENAIIGDITSALKSVGSSSSDTLSYNWTNEVSEENAIDTSILSSTESGGVLNARCVWDISHLLNKFTIPQINTSTLNIKVAQSSKVK